MIKKLYAINYVVLRALFVIGALALFLGVLPANPETGRRAVHFTIGGIAIAVGIGLAFAGRAVKRKGLEDGLAPDVFTPHGSQAIVSYFWLIVMTVLIVLPFYVIVVTSIKTEYESASLGFSWWPKLGVTGSAYKYVTTSKILGITPKAPGFSEFDFNPNMCGLKWIKGTIPTPLGLIEVFSDGKESYARVVKI